MSKFYRPGAAVRPTRYRGVILAVAPLVAILCLGSQLAAQDRTTHGILRGLVTSEETGSFVPHVNVAIKGTHLGASTTATGYFIIPWIPVGDHVAVISHVAFETQEIAVRIRPGEITEIAVHLVPRIIESEGFEVTAKAPARPNEANLGIEKLSAQEIKMVPQLAEPDVFRVLQLLPGVSATSDVSVRYYVRGGGSDQNLVLLNGATIYSPFHTLGIFSVVDPEVVSAIEFYKGGFPPAYGDRLSSVLRIVTKEGNMNRFAGAAQAGLLSGKIALEGPIPVGSLILTARKSWYAETLKRRIPTMQAPFNFYDVFGQLSLFSEALDKDSRFSIFGFLTDDKVRNDDPFQADYTVRNTIVGANWRKVWPSPLYSVAAVSYSGLRANVEPKLSTAAPRTNGVNDVTVDWDFTYLYGSRDELAFGAHFKQLNMGLDIRNASGYQYLFSQAGTDFSLYGEYKFYRYESFGATVGLRVKFSSFTTRGPVLAEPRVSLTYRLNPVMTLKGSFGYYSQELVSLTDENELISVFEPWLIMPEYLSSSMAIQTAVGLTTYLSEQSTLGLEGYYKSTNDLIDINPDKYGPKDKDFINVEGRSYGLEGSLTYEPGWLLVRTSYALSWAYKIRGGEEYFPRYDTRHAASMFIGVRLTGGWSFSATWVFRSGMPFTPISGYYERIAFPNNEPSYNPSLFQTVVDWGTRNSGRLPTYHRLDLGVTKRIDVEPLVITVEGSIVNVYNRENIFYYDRDTGKRINMLPFLPSVSVKVEW
jgi:hypothetical protein